MADGKEENNLVVRQNTDITFNDSFFSRDDNINSMDSEKKEVHSSTNNRNEVYDNISEPYEEEGFSYQKYEREKRLALGEEEESEKEGNFKLLTTILSVGAVGIVGYFGLNYFQEDSKSDSNGVTVAKSVDSNNTKEVKEGDDKIKMAVDDSKNREEKREESKALVDTIEAPAEVAKLSSVSTPPASTSMDKSVPDAKETPFDDRQKEIMEKVIKTLKEKRENSLSPAPTHANIIESVDKEKVVVQKKSIAPEKKTVKVVKKTKRVKAKKDNSKRSRYRVVVVKKGDTLASIAKKYYGNPMEYKRIIRANRDLRKGSRHLHIGQKLIVPLINSSKNSKKSKKRRFVIVRKGDTLASIAKRIYGDSTKFQKIINANYNIKSKNTPIHIGQKIYVPR